MFDIKYDCVEILLWIMHSEEEKNALFTMF